MPPSDPTSRSAPSTSTPSVESAETSQRELGYDEVRSVLELAAREPPGLTLIGGQALNYWADRYLDRSPALQALARQRPFTSGDVDFVGPLAERPTRSSPDSIDVAGELAVGEKLARALHGQFERAGLYAPRATLATVQYRDDRDDPGAKPRVIHFLGEMVGVTPVDVARTSLVVQGHLRVMNPVHSMESRISNVLRLASYRNDKGRHQARVSIPCAQEFLRELVDAGRYDQVLDFNERIFELARRNAKGCAKEGFRPFDTILVDERLPEKFRAENYPRMKQTMEKLERGRGR